MDNSFDRLKSIESENKSLLIQNSLKLCPKCHSRMFTYPGNVLRCDVCNFEDFTDEKKIRDALEIHGRLTTRELSRITGISPEIINAYLKDSFLEIKQGSFLKCELCGSLISSGLICTSCAKEHKDKFSKNISVGTLILRR